MTPFSTIDTPLIGDSTPMRRLRALVATVAPTRLPVLIEGATGTGKELVASALHRQSGRSGALVTFNVCALGESMFEDALFGHARGAYTGALTESLGFLREANGGTAFLDEITGLPLALQAKLLRAIETGVFRPIGASRDARSDFRPVAATNERVDRLVDEGRFRADLAYRLRGIVLTVPRLEERAEDIPLLVEHFVRQFAVRTSSGGEPAVAGQPMTRTTTISESESVYGNGARRGVEPVIVLRSVMQRLQARAWPGNVRELRQVVETALVFARGVVDDEALEMALAHRTRSEPSVVAEHGDAPVNAHADRHELLGVLERAGWNADEAAKLLGVHRATLYRRMKRLAVQMPRATVAPSRTMSHVVAATGATGGGG